MLTRFEGNCGSSPTARTTTSAHSFSLPPLLVNCCSFPSSETRIRSRSPSSSMSDDATRMAFVPVGNNFVRSSAWPSLVPRSRVNPAGPDDTRSERPSLSRSARCRDTPETVVSDSAFESASNSLFFGAIRLVPEEPAINRSQRLSPLKSSIRTSSAPAGHGRPSSHRKRE